MNEKDLNKNHFSNSDKQLFLINLKSQLDMGALLSRYSRTSNLDIRDLFYREFSENEKRGREFYERVFLEYGDESIAELVNVHMGVQNISNLLVKLIEETRIGASYIEKSSRYVRYDKKVDGKYLYLPFESTGIKEEFHEKYESLMERMFDYYSRTLPVLEKIIGEAYPLESITPDLSDHNLKAYQTALRSRALDDIRSILPVSTLTNVGISSNARAIVSIIQKLESANFKEAKIISDLLYSEMYEEYGEIIKSARNNHGAEHTKYLSSLSNFLRYSNTVNNFDKDTVLLNYNEWAIKNLGILFNNEGNGNISLKEITNYFFERRKNRRDKVPRQFEFVDLTYSLRMNYGAFREFQRHRMFSILRGQIDPVHGFHIPEYIKENQILKEEFEQICTESAELYRDIFNSGSKYEAQYVLPFATRYNILVKTNLRELVYFAELRSTPQAHPDLRIIAQDMAIEFLKKQPELVGIFKFLDKNSYPLGRFSQEARKEKKISNMEKSE